MRVQTNPLEEILIVDDSPTQAERLRYLLEQHGYHVMVASDGEEALTLLVNDKPALVISDIVMPVMDGCELCRRINANADTKHIPVILLTSLSDVSDVLESLACGADSFITKPYSDEALLSRVADTIASHAASAKGDSQLVKTAIVVGGKRHEIVAETQQMATLLVSTYQAASIRNRELLHAQADLNASKEHLEDLVYERTAALVAEIGERNRVEQALNESNAFSIMLIETIPDAMDIVNKDGQVLFMNSALERLVGESALGAKCWELYKDDHKRCVNCPLDQSIEAGTKRVVESSGVLGGRVFEISQTGIIHQGQPAVLEVFHDITKRKQAESVMDQRLFEQAAVNKVSAAMRAALSEDSKTSVLLTETLAVFGAAAGAVWLYQSKGNELRAIEGRGWLDGLDDLPAKFCAWMAGAGYSDGDAYFPLGKFLAYALGDPSFQGRIPEGWGGTVATIKSVDNAVGFVVIAVQQPRELTGDEARVLVALADIASNVIRQTQMHAETARRLEQAEALQVIDVAIASRSDLTAVLDTLLEQVEVILKADACMIGLIDPYNGTLNRMAKRGFRPSDALPASIRFGAGYAGKAILEKRTIVIPDLRAVGPLDSLDQPPAEYNFVSCCVAPLMFNDHALGALTIAHRSPLSFGAEWLELLKTLAGRAAMAVGNAKLDEDLNRSNSDLKVAYERGIVGWSRALDLRDKETEGHSERVTVMTVGLATAMGIEQQDIEHVRRGALMHDIGKMGVPDAILLKPEPLTADEWQAMRKHPAFALALLGDIEYLQMALDIPYCHHEKWDGSGYPRGLQGEAIPLVARIFAVVDVFDALTSERPYRAAWPAEKALAHIREQSGKHFDPRVVDAFLANDFIWRPQVSNQP